MHPLFDQFAASVNRVPVPEAPGLFVRQFTLAEVRRFGTLFEEAKGDNINVYPDIVATATVDDRGAQIVEPEEVHRLPFTLIDRIAVAALEANHMLDARKGKDAPTEAAEGN